MNESFGVIAMLLGVALLLCAVLPVRRWRDEEERRTRS